MAEKRNSASRLLSTLENAISRYHLSDENVLAVDVWHEVFSEEHQEITSTLAEKYFLVMNYLPLMRFQLEIAQEHLKAIGIRSETYEYPFEKIGFVLSPSALDEEWQTYHENLDAEVMLALNFCKDIMPDDESEISETALQTLAKEVDELELSLDSSELSSNLKFIIKQYINSIRRALGEYRIVGARSLKSANNRIVGELIEVQVEIKESNDKPAVKKLGTLFKKVNDMADAVIKTEKVVQISHRTVNFFLQLFS